MEWIWGFFCVVVHITAVVASDTTACHKDSRSSKMENCLDGVRDAFVSRDRFWFGEDFKEKCPTPKNDIECYASFSPRLNGYSISDLLFVDGTFTDSYVIDQFLEVGYTSKPGSYVGCLHKYTFSDTMTFDLDPLSTTTYEPWHGRDMPEVRWEADADTWYSLFVLHPVNGVVHGAWANIQGNNIDQADELQSYHGPLTPRDVGSGDPLVFALFEQNAGKMAVEQSWRDAVTDMAAKFNMSDMVKPGVMDLHGPVAVNWFLSGYDAYAVDTRWQHDMSVMNCVPFIEEALLSHNRGDSDLVDLSVFVNLTFQSPSRQYKFCCEKHEYKAETFHLDPIGNGTRDPIQIQSKTPREVKMVYNRFHPNATKDFAHQYFTIMALDPDCSESVSTDERPLLHWLHINLKVMSGSLDLEGGSELLPYVGPMPPNDDPHIYYFLVFLQLSEEMNLQDYSQYLGNCTEASQDLQKRCLFDKKSFWEDNNLMLVGATWLQSQKDDWVCMKKGKKESSVCAGRQGYASPCPTGGATHIEGSTAVLAAIFTMLLMLSS